jgi:methyl-accepting chemotaxis protein
MLIHKENNQIKQVAEELAVTGYLSLSTDKKELMMNVELLKKSFEMVAPQKEIFARGFYERLFTDYPATRQLFARTDMRRQESSLMATLAVVIAGVERGDNLVPVVQQLGEKHGRYGAMAEHYPIVGAVLLEMLHQHLDSQFTVEMQDAWDQAFELISTQMITGTHKRI